MSDEEKKEPEVNELPKENDNNEESKKVALEAARVRKKYFDSMTYPLKLLNDNIIKLQEKDIELAAATKEAFKAVMRTCGANRDKIKANRENPTVNNSTANKELWEEIKITVENFGWPENLRKGVEEQLSGLKGMMEQKPDLVNYMADLGAEGKVEISDVVSDVNSKQAELDKDVKDAASDLGKEEVDEEQYNREKLEQGEAENRQTSKEEKQKNDGTFKWRPFGIGPFINELRGVETDESSSTMRNRPRNRPLRQVSKYLQNVFKKSKGGRP